MRYRFDSLSRRESDALIDEAETYFETRGFGLWAVERKWDGRLIGYNGFGTSEFDAPFCPAVDIGWTLARHAWGRGYATEGAIAAVDYAFDHIGLDEVVAHTTHLNERSRAVMDRLGMSHDPADDFDAPWYPPGHLLRRFVLYRLRASEWRRSTPKVAYPSPRSRAGSRIIQPRGKERHLTTGSRSKSTGPSSTAFGEHLG